jgi:hypothetical protein
MSHEPSEQFKNLLEQLNERGASVCPVCGRDDGSGWEGALPTRLPSSRKLRERYSRAHIPYLASTAITAASSGSTTRGVSELRLGLLPQGREAETKKNRAADRRLPRPGPPALAS